MVEIGWVIEMDTDVSLGDPLPEIKYHQIASFPPCLHALARVSLHLFR
jgi:hypothetical protein